jgi:hypothetical protein
VKNGSREEIDRLRNKDRCVVGTMVSKERTKIDDHLPASGLCSTAAARRWWEAGRRRRGDGAAARRSRDASGRKGSPGDGGGGGGSRVFCLLQSVRYRVRSLREK